MTEGDPWLSIRFGCHAGSAHLLFAVFIAFMVAIGRSSPEAWFFIAMVDTPMNLILLLPLDSYIPRYDLWAPLSFLPGRLGSWDFLFSFLYFVILGTAFWFMLGWLFGRLTHRVRYGHWKSYESTPKFTMTPTSYPVSTRALASRRLAVESGG